MSLNLFPARVPIGSIQIPDQNGVPQQYTVLPTVEFLRALSDLFKRVGGADGLGNEDLAVLASSAQASDTAARNAIEDLQAIQANSSAAMIAEMQRTIEDLRSQVSEISGAISYIANLRSRIDGVEVLASYREQPRVDWERPGKLGYLKENSVDCTTLNALAEVNLNPAGSDVNLKPTGLGIVVIKPVTAGFIDNMEIGKTTKKPARVTTLNKVIITQPANTATLTLDDASVLITAGSWTETFTFTADTTVTFPVIGTLATLAGIEAFTNKSVNGITLAGTAGSTLNVGTGGTLGTAAYTLASAYVPAMTPVASGGAASTTGATNVAPYGYTTAAQANEIVTKLNLVISALVGDSIMS